MRSGICGTKVRVYRMVFLPDPIGQRSFLCNQENLSVQKRRNGSASLWVQRAKESVGMMMIGDGLLAIINPRGHICLWERGPAIWERMMAPFSRHPSGVRLLGGLELAAGVLLSVRQYESEAMADGDKDSSAVSASPETVQPCDYSERNPTAQSTDRFCKEVGI